MGLETIALAMECFMFSFFFQAGKEFKFYGSPRSNCLHKLLIPLVVLLAAGAAAPFFLLPYEKLSHTCTDPYGVLDVLDTESESFTIDLYSTLVMVFTYVLPVSYCSNQIIVL